MISGTVCVTLQPSKPSCFKIPARESGFLKFRRLALHDENSTKAILYLQTLFSSTKYLTITYARSLSFGDSFDQSCSGLFANKLFVCTLKEQVGLITITLLGSTQSRSTAYVYPM
ncbi:hypothetical protein M0804_001992 [Polistes exclamans]|nr:hypothetical protein M0804_001992 [Polistes exclamans]